MASSVVDLVRDLRSRGVVLAVDGSRLVCTPRTLVADAEIPLLRRLKGSIVALVSFDGRQNTKCYSCGGSRYWISASAVVCSTCHPPAIPRLVIEEMDLGVGDASA